MSLTLLIFIIVYVGLTIGSFPGLALDRSGMALVGMIVLLTAGEITPQHAMQSVNLGTMALILGMMILSAQLDVAGFYDLSSRFLGRLRLQAKSFLAILIIIVGAMSALLSNDIVCVAFSPVLIQICRGRSLNPVPFLLALAFAANAGSALTVLGSPQSMLIAETLHISFLSYLRLAAIPGLVALLVCWGVVSFLYRHKFSSDEKTDATVPATDRKFDRFESYKGLVIGALLIGGMVFTSFPRGLLALSAAAILLVNRRFQTRTMLGKVDWELLVLLVGLFVLNEAFQATGLIKQWVGDLSHYGIDLASNTWVFWLTAVLSDLVSNVPAVMLLLPLVHTQSGGIAMALGSTLSSNLLITGSLANMIVLDAAAKENINIGFLEFAWAGIPVALLSLAFAFLWTLLGA